MNDFTVKSIGRIRSDENGFSVKLEKEYIPALAGLEGFSHIQLLYWFDKCDGEASRVKLTESKPYVNGPDIIGTFATRSPERPNPIVGCDFLFSSQNTVECCNKAFFEALFLQRGRLATLPFHELVIAVPAPRCIFGV